MIKYAKLNQDDVLSIMMILGHTIERNLYSRISMNNKVEFFMYVYGNSFINEEIESNILDKSNIVDNDK